MRRREAVAGIASLGVVASGAAFAVFGRPDREDPDGAGDGSRQERLEIETFDVRGSEPGTVTIPASDRATFVDLFGTWCTICKGQMPVLAEAYDRIGDEALFVSVTAETISDEELGQWWDEHGGTWTVGHDHNAEVTERYLEGGYPTAVAIDAGGTVRWSGVGEKSADEIVSGIERAIEASTDGTAETEADAGSSADIGSSMDVGSRPASDVDTV